MITITRGTDQQFTLTLSSAGPFELAGSSIEVSVQDTTGALVLTQYLTVDVFGVTTLSDGLEVGPDGTASGEIVQTLTAAQTLALTTPTAMWTMKLTDSDGLVSFPMFGQWAITSSPGAFGTTRRSLRRKILRQLGDLIVVQATAVGSDVTLIDQAHLIGEPDAYRGRSIYFTGGTPENVGEERYITGSNKIARNVSFDYALPMATGIGDEAEICNMKGVGYKFQDVHDAIDSAIDNGADMALIPSYQLVSTYFSDSTGTVAIPDDWVGIGGIQWRDADDEEWQFLTMSSRAVGSGWSIDRSNRVVDIAGYTARRVNSKQVRLYGFTRPGTLTGDDDATPIDSEWLVKEAMSQLVYAGFLKNPSPERERVLMMNEQRAAIARSKATRRTGGMIRL